MRKSLAYSFTCLFSFTVISSWPVCSPIYTTYITFSILNQWLCINGRQVVCNPLPLYALYACMHLYAVYGVGLLKVSYQCAISLIYFFREVIPLRNFRRSQSTLIGRHMHQGINHNLLAMHRHLGCPLWWYMVVHCTVCGFQGENSREERVWWLDFRYHVTETIRITCALTH